MPGLVERQWWRRPPTLAAQVLRPLAAAYGALAAVNKQLARPTRLTVPVIVVGNLVAGGAGKTPATIALVLVLRERGWQPGVVSRGYARLSNDTLAVGPASTAAEVGDEPLLIARRTGAPVVVDRQRVRAGRMLLAQHPQVDVLVADDGLQHHRLARDAQLIVIDERGFGNGLLLPAGPLREYPGSAPPARSVVLYNAPAPSAAWPGWTAQRSLHGAVAFHDWLSGTAPSVVAPNFDALRAQRFVAAAGIAAPERFFGMLRDQGLQFDPCPLPDHNAWLAPPAMVGDRMLLVTEKDAVKLDPHAPYAARTWVAPLDLALPVPLINALLALLPAHTHR